MAYQCSKVSSRVGGTDLGVGEGPEAAPPCVAWDFRFTRGARVAVLFRSTSAVELLSAITRNGHMCEVICVA